MQRDTKNEGDSPGSSWPREDDPSPIVMDTESLPLPRAERLKVPRAQARGIAVEGGEGRGEGARAASGRRAGSIGPTVLAPSALTPPLSREGREREKSKGGITRRAMLAAAALPLVAVHPRRARAAEFTYKFATGQDPTHPVNVRAQEAIDRIQKASDGRLEMRLFPANQLGSDTDLLSQVRTGGVDFFNLATSILNTLVPAAGLVNIGFAFKDYDAVWSAADGDLGKYIAAQITKVGLISVTPLWDNGFRQITSSTRDILAPADLKGFKIRVPPAPILTSLFQSLGASPTPINFNELYSALQTKVVEGQENPLAIIATTKLYEVQKSLSMTGHVWDGYQILGNRRSWERLPQDLRDIVQRELAQSGKDERADIAKLSISLRQNLATKGMVVHDVDRAAFRAALNGTSYYKDWKAKFGDQAWEVLEATSGKLT